MYHSVGGGYYDDVSVEQFRRDLEYLDNAYTIVDLPEVLETGGEKRVALTFDDGTADFYENALPVLREFDAPATVFVIGKTIDDQSFVHDSEYEYEYMRLEELERLIDVDLITIGNHTVTHPDLRDCSRETLETEIAGGKYQLERALGISLDRFCYPYGGFDERAVSIARRTHEYAVTTGDGMVRANADPMRLPRTNGATSQVLLRWHLTDLGQKLRPLTDRL